MKSGQTNSKPRSRPRSAQSSNTVTPQQSTRRGNGNRSLLAVDWQSTTQGSTDFRAQQRRNVSRSVVVDHVQLTEAIGVPSLHCTLSSKRSFELNFSAEVPLSLFEGGGISLSQRALTVFFVGVRADDGADPYCSYLWEQLTQNPVALPRQASKLTFSQSGEYFAGRCALQGASSSVRGSLAGSFRRSSSNARRGTEPSAFLASLGACGRKFSAVGTSTPTGRTQDTGAETSPLQPRTGSMRKLSSAALMTSQTPRVTLSGKGVVNGVSVQPLYNIAYLVTIGAVEDQTEILIAKSKQSAEDEQIEALLSWTTSYRTGLGVHSWQSGTSHDSHPPPQAETETKTGAGRGIPPLWSSDDGLGHCILITSTTGEESPAQQQVDSKQKTAFTSSATTGMQSTPSQVALLSEQLRSEIVNAETDRQRRARERSPFAVEMGTSVSAPFPCLASPQSLSLGSPEFEQTKCFSGLRTPEERREGDKVTFKPTFEEEGQPLEGEKQRAGAGGTPKEPSSLGGAYDGSRLGDRSASILSATTSALGGAVWSPLYGPRVDVLGASWESSGGRKMVIQLSSIFHKYLMGVTAKKVCPVRASKLTIPIVIDEGMSSLQCSNFIMFLGDCHRVVDMQRDAYDKTFDWLRNGGFHALSPHEVINALIAMCGASEQVEGSEREHSRGKHFASDIPYSSKGPWRVDWFDFLLLATTEKPLWGKLLRIMKKFREAIALSPLFREPLPRRPTRQQVVDQVLELHRILCYTATAAIDKNTNASAEVLSQRLQRHFGIPPEVQALQSPPGSAVFGSREDSVNLTPSASATANLHASTQFDQTQILQPVSQCDNLQWIRIFAVPQGASYTLHPSPSRAVWCMFSWKHQHLASQLVGKGLPLLVTRKKANKNLRQLARAVHLEAESIDLFRMKFYKRWLTHTRTQREIVRRRQLLSVALERRFSHLLENRFYHKWVRYLVQMRMVRVQVQAFDNLKESIGIGMYSLYYRKWRLFPPLKTGERNVAVANTNLIRRYFLTLKAFVPFSKSGVSIRDLRWKVRCHLARVFYSRWKQAAHQRVYERRSQLAEQLALDVHTTLIRRVFRRLGARVWPTVWKNRRRLTYDTNLQKITDRAHRELQLSRFQKLLAFYRARLRHRRIVAGLEALRVDARDRLHHRGFCQWVKFVPLAPSFRERRRVRWNLAVEKRKANQSAFCLRFYRRWNSFYCSQFAQRRREQVAWAFLSRVQGSLRLNSFRRWKRLIVKKRAASGHQQIANVLLGNSDHRVMWAFFKRWCHLSRCFQEKESIRARQRQALEHLWSTCSLPRFLRPFFQWWVTYSALHKRKVHKNNVASALLKRTEGLLVRSRLRFWINSVNVVHRVRSLAMEESQQRWAVDNQWIRSSAPLFTEGFGLHQRAVMEREAFTRKHILEAEEPQLRETLELCMVEHSDRSQIVRAQAHARLEVSFDAIQSKETAVRMHLQHHSGALTQSLCLRETLYRNVTVTLEEHEAREHLSSSYALQQAAYIERSSLVESTLLTSLPIFENELVIPILDTERTEEEKERRQLSRQEGMARRKVDPASVEVYVHCDYCFRRVEDDEFIEIDIGDGTSMILHNSCLEPWTEENCDACALCGEPLSIELAGMGGTMHPSCERLDRCNKQLAEVEEDEARIRAQEQEVVFQCAEVFMQFSQEYLATCREAEKDFLEGVSSPFGAEHSIIVLRELGEGETKAREDLGCEVQLQGAAIHLTEWEEPSAVTGLKDEEQHERAELEQQRKEDALRIEGGKTLTDLEQEESSVRALWERRWSTGAECIQQDHHETGARQALELEERSTWQLELDYPFAREHLLTNAVSVLCSTARDEFVLSLESMGRTTLDEREAMVRQDALTMSSFSRINLEEEAMRKAQEREESALMSFWEAEHALFVAANAVFTEAAVACSENIFFESIGKDIQDLVEQEHSGRTAMDELHSQEYGKLRDAEGREALMLLQYESGRSAIHRQEGEALRKYHSLFVTVRLDIAIRDLEVAQAFALEEFVLEECQSFPGHWFGGFGAGLLEGCQALEKKQRFLLQGEESQRSHWDIANPFAAQTLHLSEGGARLEVTGEEQSHWHETMECHHTEFWPMAFEHLFHGEEQARCAVQDSWRETSEKITGECQESFAWSRCCETERLQAEGRAHLLSGEFAHRQTMQERLDVVTLLCREPRLFYLTCKSNPALVLSVVNTAGQPTEGHGHGSLLFSKPIGSPQQLWAVGVEWTRLDSEEGMLGCYFNLHPAHLPAQCVTYAENETKGLLPCVLGLSAGGSSAKSIHDATPQKEAPTLHGHQPATLCSIVPGLKPGWFRVSIFASRGGKKEADEKNEDKRQEGLLCAQQMGPSGDAVLEGAPLVVRPLEQGTTAHGSPLRKGRGAQHDANSEEEEQQDTDYSEFHFQPTALLPGMYEIHPLSLPNHCLTCMVDPSTYLRSAGFAPRSTAHQPRNSRRYWSVQLQEDGCYSLNPVYLPGECLQCYGVDDACLLADCDAHNPHGSWHIELQSAPDKEKETQGITVSQQQYGTKWPREFFSVVSKWNQSALAAVSSAFQTEASTARRDPKSLTQRLLFKSVGGSAVSRGSLPLEGQASMGTTAASPMQPPPPRPRVVQIHEPTAAVAVSPRQSPAPDRTRQKTTGTPTAGAGRSAERPLWSPPKLVESEYADSSPRTSLPSNATAGHVGNEEAERRLSYPSLCVEEPTEPHFAPEQGPCRSASTATTGSVGTLPPTPGEQPQKDSSAPTRETRLEGLAGSGSLKKEKELETQTPLGASISSITTVKSVASGTSTTGTASPKVRRWRRSSKDKERRSPLPELLVTPGTYRIHCKQTPELVLGCVSSGEAGEGTQFTGAHVALQLKEGSAGSPRQQWTVRCRDAGDIISLSPLCASGHRLQCAEPSGICQLMEVKPRSAPQSWRVENASVGFVSFVSVSTGSVLEVVPPMDSGAFGMMVRTNPARHCLNNQHFLLLPVDDVTDDRSEDKEQHKETPPKESSSFIAVEPFGGEGGLGGLELGDDEVDWMAQKEQQYTERKLQRLAAAAENVLLQRYFSWWGNPIGLHRVESLTHRKNDLVGLQSKVSRLDAWISFIQRRSIMLRWMEHAFLRMHKKAHKKLLVRHLTTWWQRSLTQRTFGKWLMFTVAALEEQHLHEELDFLRPEEQREKQHGKKTPPAYASPKQQRASLPKMSSAYPHPRHSGAEIGEKYEHPFVSPPHDSLPHFRQPAQEVGYSTPTPGERRSSYAPPEGFVTSPSLFELQPPPSAERKKKKKEIQIQTPEQEPLLVSRKSSSEGLNKRLLESAEESGGPQRKQRELTSVDSSSRLSKVSSFRGRTEEVGYDDRSSFLRKGARKPSK